MFNNPYMFNNQQDLINLRDRIDKQLNQMSIPQSQQTPITQNFQLAPTNQSSGLKYVNSIDDVKNEFVINDTLFINKEFSRLWLKQANGEVKTYTVEELIELDEKDLKIANLERELREIKEGLYAKPNDSNVDEPTSIKKSTNVSNDKSSKK